MEGVDHLAHERSKAQFDVDQMKVVWVGSRHALQVSDRIARLVASDPVISSHLICLVSEKMFERLRILVSHFSS